jgi:hypothetical protein
MTPFAEWESFYVIVGSSAGALVGLQFVVITLLADMPVEHGQEQAGAAFATPTVLHFGAVLLLSAVVSAPWHRVSSAALLWGLLGLGGIGYEIVAIRRMRVQTHYKLQFEDVLFHALLPLVAYGTLAGSALAARLSIESALFAVGGAALLLLFVGIHNSWDAITYFVFVTKRKAS